MKLITLGILSIGFLFVNFLLRRLFSIGKHKARFMGLIHRYFPLAELVFWALFILWASSILLGDTPYYSFFMYTFFLLVIILFSWFFLKDYVAGVQIRSRFHFSSGQPFRSDKVTGIVKKISLLYLEIRADNGSDFRIPYSKIDQSTLELNVQTKSSGESKIKVFIDQKLDEDIAMKKIGELVINSAWTSHKSAPVISVQKAEKGLKCYEISCMTHGDQANNKLKALIEKKLASTSR